MPRTLRRCGRTGCGRSNLSKSSRSLAAAAGPALPQPRAPPAWLLRHYTLRRRTLLFAIQLLWDWSRLLPSRLLCWRRGRYLCCRSLLFKVRILREWARFLCDANSHTHSNPDSNSYADSHGNLGQPVESVWWTGLAWWNGLQAAFCLYCLQCLVLTMRLRPLGLIRKGRGTW